MNARKAFFLLACLFLTFYLPYTVYGWKALVFMLAFLNLLTFLIREAIKGE